MKTVVTDLIHQYLDSAQTAVNQLCVTHGATDVLSDYWSGKIPKSGPLSDNPGDQYNFHGLGCFFSLGDVRIDVDFEPGVQALGFDAWRLFRFAQETLRLDTIQLKDLEEELARAAEEGSLVHKGHLYFMSS